MTPEPVSRLVAVIDQPVAISDLQTLIADLESAHGTGLRITSGAGEFTIRTPGRACGCTACVDQDAHVYTRLTGRLPSRSLIVCPDCVHKRCPKAGNHDQPCWLDTIPSRLPDQRT